jgi:hypothetical protein
MRKLSILLAILFLIQIACKPDRLLNVKDGFDSDSLSTIWTRDKFIHGALNFQTIYVRSGNKAAMLTLRPGDQIEEEKGTILERAELKESKKLFAVEKSIYEYSFSIFLPPDFPIVPSRLVIAQWKQDCKSGDCDPASPVIALRFVSGKFYVTLQTEPKQITLFSQDETILNQWLDFKFKIQFSRMQDGVIKAWLNGEQIIDYKGITAYTQTYGYPIPGVFYFKMGLYRDHMDLPMTIYLDDYKKNQIPNL